MNTENLKKLAKLIRYYILISTTEAGSGHPTSSMSATELMTTLLFGGYFKSDINNPDYHNNDRLIFSKGHAAPLFYALWAAAGKVSEEELLSLRKFDSPLEGHPTMEFPYTEAATGSLGQGLSIGLGMALNAKLENVSYKTFVLLGDSESVWEAIEIAAHYKLDNLIGILDVNRLGQRGETMYGHDTSAYERRISAFGWETIVVKDGHDLNEITSALAKAMEDKTAKPTMLIAKTLKGKGVLLVEDKNGWHGKTLSKEELAKALEELGEIDKNVRGEMAKPQSTKTRKHPPQLIEDEAGENIQPEADPSSTEKTISVADYPLDKPLATRKVYGKALARIFPKYPNIVVLDAETSNSTYAEQFKQVYPDRFFEMFIAEQNMVGTALGFSRRGKIPFVSTFAAFFSRAHDQIRMSQYSGANIKFVGSHAGAFPYTFRVARGLSNG